MLQTVLAQSRSLAVGAHTLQRELAVHQTTLPPEVSQAAESVQQEIVSALNVYAEGLAGDGCQSPAPVSLDALKQSFASASPRVPARLEADILDAMDTVVLQLTKLPSWGETTTAPVNMELSPSHV